MKKSLAVHLAVAAFAAAPLSAATQRAVDLKLPAPAAGLAAAPPTSMFLSAVPAALAAAPVAAANDAGLATRGFQIAPSPEHAVELKLVNGIIARLFGEMSRVVVGQKEMIESIIEAKIGGGHILIEGLPGSGKTYSATTAAIATGGKFGRVQGTSDKQPSDIIGNEVLRDTPEGKSLVLVKGPIFADFVLHDEFNRNPPKAQSAVLESMEERQVTIANETHKLPKTQSQIATMNPVEQEGVFPVSQAAQDRFMYKVIPTRTTVEERTLITRRNEGLEEKPVPQQVTTPEELERIGRLAKQVHVDAAIHLYVAHIIEATHVPSQYGIAIKPGVVEGGSSDRGAQFLIKAAKIHALLDGRMWVGPEDVAAVAHRVLRHRITLGYEAQREKLTADTLIDKILEKVKVPAPTGAR
jgi:MoxR-like ATPase